MPTLTPEERILRAIKEDDLLTYVIENARWLRWKIHHIRNSKEGVVQGDVGFPDVIIGRSGRLIASELKTETGKLTDGQAAWMDVFLKAGVEYYIWRPCAMKNGDIERYLR